MTESSERPLEEYYAALQRLQNGEPINVPIGTKITNDAVSLEAGRGKGSIKKSRALFADLIGAIQEAARLERDPEHNPKEKVARSQARGDYYRLLYEAALARELSLLKELYELKKQLSKLTGGKVIPLWKKKTSGSDGEE